MIYFMSMMLTEQCNSLCKYCYVNARTEPQELLPVRDIQDFLKRYAEQGGRMVLLTGGEVLLYPGIGEVAQSAKGLGLRVSLFTNGLLLDQTRLDQLKDSVDAFAISLDGPEEIHDARRGVRGAYRKALEAMRLLQAAKKEFTIQMTIGKSNREHIDHVAGIAREFKVGGVKLADMMKVGRAADCPEEQLSEEDLLYIKRKAAELSEQSQYQIIYQTNLTTQEELNLYYQRGDLHPVYWVDSRGNIFMYITHHDFFQIGHISEFPLNKPDEARIRQSVAQTVFPQLGERRICDIFEEIERLADAFSSANSK